MTKTDLLFLLAEFTREDWREFERFRTDAFEPTEEEVAANEAAHAEYVRNLVSGKLAKYGVTKPETVTKEWVIGFLETIQAQQFVGDDLSGWVDNQIILFGTIDKAFDELVSRYL